MGLLTAALNETLWGQVVPQLIATAKTDKETRAIINGFMKARKKDMLTVFQAAEERGELAKDAPVNNIIEMAISVPYHRKFIAGLPLDHDWLDSHIEALHRLATVG